MQMGKKANSIVFWFAIKVVVYIHEFGGQCFFLLLSGVFASLCYCFCASAQQNQLVWNFENWKKWCFFVYFRWNMFVQNWCKEIILLFFLMNVFFGGNNSHRVRNILSIRGDVGFVLTLYWRTFPQQCLTRIMFTYGNTGITEITRIIALIQLNSYHISFQLFHAFNKCVSIYTCSKWNDLKKRCSFVNQMGFIPRIRPLKSKDCKLNSSSLFVEFNSKWLLLTMDDALAPFSK